MLRIVRIDALGELLVGLLRLLFVAAVAEQAHDLLLVDLHEHLA